MIINGVEVQGLYVYSPDSRNIRFTKNDLVISNNCLYICTNPVQGIDPASDTGNAYYQPYPGSKVITASEFFTYVKEGTMEDKYVSSQALMGILQGYQFGLDMEGVITDYIDENGDTTLILSSITTNPLDNLMLTETLNRGMIKVSHGLSQIVDGKVGDIPFSTLFGFLEKNDPVSGEPIDYQLILSQYTYKSSPTLYIRVQEMMSPLTGVSVYRFMSWKSEEFPSNGNTISSWRSVFSYSSAIKNKLDALDEYYKTLADQMRAREESESRSFRFKEYYDGSDTSLTRLNEGVYTVCLDGTSDGKTLSESVVVRLGDGSSGNKKIYFNKTSEYRSRS